MYQDIRASLFSLNLGQFWGEFSDSPKIRPRRRRSATFWIPAFAGMTGLESGNGGRNRGARRGNHPLPSNANDRGGESQESEVSLRRLVESARNPAAVLEFAHEPAYAALPCFTAVNVRMNPYRGLRQRRRASAAGRPDPTVRRSAYRRRSGCRARTGSVRRGAVERAIHIMDSMRRMQFSSLPTVASGQSLRKARIAVRLFGCIFQFDMRPSYR